MRVMRNGTTCARRAARTKECGDEGMMEWRATKDALHADQAELCEMGRNFPGA